MTGWRYLGLIAVLILHGCGNEDPLPMQAPESARATVTSAPQDPAENERVQDARRIAERLKILEAKNPETAPNVAGFWYGTDGNGNPTIRVHLFTPPRCGTCQPVSDFVARIRARNDWIEIVPHELGVDREAGAVFSRVRNFAGNTSGGLPAIAVCGELHGYLDSSAAAALDAAIYRCYSQLRQAR